jgi:putative tryptophan/tyrosine transport system ATP-binding protein
VKAIFPEKGRRISVLQLNNISKIFNEGTPDEKNALDSVSLSLTAGDFVTVIGSNGAGKSTLMNIISGVMIPDAGSVKINGKNVAMMPEHKRSFLIGRVFQDPMAGTAPSMTIEENLAMAYSRNKSRTLKRGVTRKRRDNFREVLETLHLGLENRLNAKVGLLSGGERQALSLLMATFTEPSILLLDEHTAALDPARAELITRLTKEIVSNYKLTTIMVTHNMQQALDLGNRLIMMDKGQIILEIEEDKKEKLGIEDLLNEFQRIRGRQLASDRSLLS